MAKPLLADPGLRLSPASPPLRCPQPPAPGLRRLQVGSGPGRPGLGCDSQREAGARARAVTCTGRKRGGAWRARAQRPAGPGRGAGQRSGRCFGPAAARLHSVPTGKRLLRAAPGRAGTGGGGRLRRGAGCAADSPAGPLAASGPRPRADASWRCREQGRGSELTSSRLAQGRTQAGRDPRGPEASGRAARRPCPALARNRPGGSGACGEAPARGGGRRGRRGHERGRWPDDCEGLWAWECVPPAGDAQGRCARVAACASARARGAVGLSLRRPEAAVWSRGARGRPVGCAWNNGSQGWTPPGGTADSAQAA